MTTTAMQTDKETCIQIDMHPVRPRKASISQLGQVVSAELGGEDACLGSERRTKGDHESRRYRCALRFALASILLASAMAISILIVHATVWSQAGPAPKKMPKHVPPNIPIELVQRVERFTDAFAMSPASPVEVDIDATSNETTTTTEPPKENGTSAEQYAKEDATKMDVTEVSVLDVISAVTGSMTTDELIEKDLWLSEDELDDLMGRPHRQMHLIRDEDDEAGNGNVTEASSGEDAGSVYEAGSGDEAANGNVTEVHGRRRQLVDRIYSDYDGDNALLHAGGVVRFCFDSSIGSNDVRRRTFRNAVARVSDEINFHGDCLTFTEVSACGSGMIKVGNFNPASCSCTIGANPIKVNMGWCSGAEDMGAIIHELGHALGMAHEQQRQDRDQYVNVNYEHIDDTCDANCRRDNWDIEQDAAADGRDYDYASIMHYGESPQVCTREARICEPACRWCFWNRCRTGTEEYYCNHMMTARGGQHIGRRTGGFSSNDVSQLRDIYQCSAIRGTSIDDGRQGTHAANGQWVDVLRDSSGEPMICPPYFKRHSWKRGVCLLSRVDRPADGCGSWDSSGNCDPRQYTLPTGILWPNRRWAVPTEQLPTTGGATVLYTDGGWETNGAPLNLAGVLNIVRDSHGDFMVCPPHFTRDWKRGVCQLSRSRRPADDCRSWDRTGRCDPRQYTIPNVMRQWPNRRWAVPSAQAPTTSGATVIYSSGKWVTNGVPA